MAVSKRGEIRIPIGIAQAALVRKGCTQRDLLHHLGKALALSEDTVNKFFNAGFVSPNIARAIAVHIGLDLEPFRRRLPADGLFGRDVQLEDLCSWFAQGYPVRCLVQGLTGIGKTKLTSAAARCLAAAGAFPPNRIWFARLEAAPTRELVEQCVVEAVEPGMAGFRFSDAIAMFRVAPGLLILDNLDTPIEGDERGLNGMLSELEIRAPQLAILASIRGLRSPNVAWHYRLALKSLSPAASKAMFLSIAPRVLRRDPWLDRFIEALGGMPLAINLVARRAQTRCDLADLWKEWCETGIRMAADPTGNAPEASKDASVLTSISLSWRSTDLTSEGRQLIGFLANSPAGMSTTDICKLLGADERAARDQVVRVGLAEEVDQRVDMLPPVREAARLTVCLDLPLRLRWLLYYLQLTAEAGIKVGRLGGSDSAARLKLEFGNLEHALREYCALPLAAKTEEIRIAVRSAALGFARLVGFAGAGTSHALYELGEHFSAVDCDAFNGARAFAQCGDIASRRGQFSFSRECYGRAKRIFVSLGEFGAEGHCLEWLGDAARAEGDYRAAEQLYAEAMYCYERGIASGETTNIIDGNPIGRSVGDCLWSKGELARERREWGAARHHYEQAKEVFAKCDDRRGLANCLRGLAHASLHEGLLQIAEAQLERAQDIYCELGSSFGQGQVFLALGEVALAKNQLRRAEGHFEDAKRHFLVVKNDRLAAQCRMRAADVRKRSGLGLFSRHCG